MHYLNESVGPLTKCPQQCPYCGVRNAGTRFSQTFSDVVADPGNPLDRGHSASVRIDLPACERCAAWLRKTRIHVWALGAGALGGILVAILASVAVEDRWPFAAWALVALGWLSTHLARRLRFRKLRLSEFSDPRYVYFVGEARYARELAKLNGLDCRTRSALSLAD